MNEFFARWETESPIFFKRLSKFGKWLVGAGVAFGAAAMAAPDEIHTQVVSVVKIASGYMIFGGGLIIGLCGLTVDSR